MQTKEINSFFLPKYGGHFPEKATDVKSISDCSGQCLFTSNVCPWGIVRIEMVSRKKNILLAKYKSQNNNLSLLLYDNEYALIIDISMNTFIDLKL